MPFKDKKKQLGYNQQWKLKNKEKVKEYQKRYFKQYQRAISKNKYLLLINDIQKLSYEGQIQYLLKLLGPKRQAILRRIDNIELKQDIQNIIKQKQKERRNQRLNNNWNFVKNWMTYRGCDCGENNITKLSFHHLDHSQKESTIRKMCGCSMKRIKKELKKGVVKCKNCHTIIHAGTSKKREESLINQYLKEFTDKKYRYRRKNKLLIWEYKKTLSCIKCGISDPVILLFHHIDSKLKSEKICLLYRTSRGVINKEIEKTTCLCHNCHEDFHYLYGRKDTNHTQIEQYLGKKVIPLKVDIKDYLPIMEQKISQFYDLPFLIT